MALIVMANPYGMNGDCDGYGDGYADRDDADGDFE
jgi:hypothetical protein